MHEINVTPFIDVMLVLLIIFMMAAPLASVDIKVDLRNPEQGVLLDAVTAYANVIANQGLVEAQRINVTLLREMLATTKRGSTPAT